MLSRDLIVVDVETTGPNPFVHDLLSVALVPVSLDDRPFVVHVQQVQPTWTEFGLANFQQFRSEYERTAVPPREAMRRIDEYLQALLPDRKATLVGHNVGFDFAFLRKLAFQSGQPDPSRIAHRSIDTHSLLYIAWLQGRLPDDARTSDGAFAAFGITVGDVGRHTALGDALATRTLFLRLVELLGVVHGAPA